MKATTLLLVLLSNDGYWFGGRAADVRFEPLSAAPAGRVEWVLTLGPLRLAEGAVDVAPGRTTTLRLTPPAVRVRSVVRLTYRYLDGAGTELASGSSNTSIIPDNVMADAAAVLVGVRVAIWGTDRDPLSAFLTKAKVPHDALTGAALQLRAPDVVLFGPGSLDGTSASFRPSLEGLARAGASVIVFRQERGSPFSGARLVERTVSPALAWRFNHPLLAPFTAEDLSSLAPAGSTRIAVRLPLEKPALNLAWWPAEVASSEPCPPPDALLVTRTVGGGRIVLCQLPFGDDWDDNPLGQTFLRAALEYAATPPGPNPRPCKPRIRAEQAVERRERLLTTAASEGNP